MSLRAFIGDHREKIISEFAAFARTLMPVFMGLLPGAKERFQDSPLECRILTPASAWP